MSWTYCVPRTDKKTKWSWLPSCNFSWVRQWIPEWTEFNWASECGILQAWFPSTNPDAGISLSPSTVLREFGDDVTNPEITASWTRWTNPVSDMVSVEFFRGTTSGTLINTDNSPNVWDSTSFFSDTFTIDRASIKQYTIRTTDGEWRSDTASISYNFVDPYFFGVWASWLTPIEIQWLTKLIESAWNKTTVTSPNNEVYYFAYPSSYWTLTSIIDKNNFDVTASYQLRVENFTALDWQTISYNIYEWLNITTQTNFSQTYNI